jgi:small subunit ribosomal protein S1
MDRLLPIENPELAFMADVLNPERTESAHLNTELQTPTLEAPADHFDPSEESTNNPQAETPSVPHRVVDPRPVASHPGSEETELTGMEDFAAALESFDREQAAEAAAQAYDDNVVTGTVIKLTEVSFPLSRCWITTASPN